MNMILVAIGGFFGAMARFYVGNKLVPTVKSGFPAGTFFVNITGSFLLGLLTGTVASTTTSLLIGIGFLGSYTTFSTFKVEIIRQLADKKSKEALLYMISSYFGGIALAFIGFVIGKAV
ncbi:fluoride efflux transporter CrcB [Siminovitchia acidinfaciens]|uniref:Fluoride-specific ion channel FluC n=1 Tax=Siminovitchia acidinfaciens TaxID=2321395 RepID=A0A429XTT9_9BACI|nr:fluoride efflux transporter CrcB [Siminovitchia acidinfaciens]RST71273.1 fluoride efflux transporter CrcB [Siminovitchia acidinfaciens]